MPYVGDYVGKSETHNEYFYIGAVDYNKRLVKVGTMGGPLTDWLNETQARAQYNYQWGQRKPIPWMAVAPQSLVEARAVISYTDMTLQAAKKCNDILLEKDGFEGKDHPIPQMIIRDDNWRAWVPASVPEIGRTDGRLTGFKTGSYQIFPVPYTIEVQVDNQKCVCGSGSNLKSILHSDWCQLWCDE